MTTFQIMRREPATSSSALSLAVIAILTLCLLSPIAQAQYVTPTDAIIKEFGIPPEVKEGGLDPAIVEALDFVFAEDLGGSGWSHEHTEAINSIASSNDPRLAWLISDLMRFAGPGGLQQLLGDAATRLLGISFSDTRYWGKTTDHLMAWDIPAPPDYLKYKRNIFTSIVPGWDELFIEGDIDWRHVSWGGVLIDDRPFDTTDDPCNCIPAADNPEVSTAKEATWLAEDAVIFGIGVNGEYRAYPRQIMEVREMVNDTLGGRDLGIPYCTLCGAAQAYFTDEVPDDVERPILRTSGLLIRSNKVMYDVVTRSVFDTFKGHAVTGELAARGVRLPQASVITTTWGEWKKAHPETTVLIEDLALGRDFDFRNNRDANGPIFPVGDVDPRLSVHEDIIGIVTESGTPIAFQRSAAIVELSKGKSVKTDGIELLLDSGGVRAVNTNGDDLGSHQAFWFAWSQFYPQTKLWPN